MGRSSDKEFRQASLNKYFTIRLNPDGDLLLSQIVFDLADGESAVMEDAGGQDGIRFALIKH